MRTVYGNEELKVVRVFNKEKRCVEYDTLFWDGAFTNKWRSVKRLPSEMRKSRETADLLYKEISKSRVEKYDDEE